MVLKKTAEDFAREQKEISVSEFFEKNKHLLGFDNPTKALLMAVKEAVDNSLDACEEAGILPDVSVKIKNTGEDKFRVTVKDNGPGIVKDQVPKIFGKLLYGSKFHRLRQNRGQQGIGISAVLLYSQLTTGNPTKVWSRVDEKKKTYSCELFLNTAKNEPEIVKDELIEKDEFGGHGTKVEMEMKGRYRKTIEDYLKQTSIANPFAKINYQAPDGMKVTFPRSVNELPRQPREMKLHPYGVEYGILLRFLGDANSKTLSSFLVNEFSSIGATSAKEICKLAKLDPGMKPQSLTREQTEKLLDAMQKVRIQRPPLDCLSPIGEKELEKSLRKEYPNAEFVVTATREPAVYRGNPFQIEVGIVYGGVGGNEDSIELLRFANRVPSIYQAGACATTDAVKEVDWKRYNMQQPKNSLPMGSAVVVVHMASVWVPFQSESKEAIATYEEIVGEMKLAIQEVGRRLSSYLSGKRKAGEATRRLQIFERYANEVASSIATLMGGNEKEIEKKLREMIPKRVKIMEEQEQKELEDKKDSNSKETEISGKKSK